MWKDSLFFSKGEKRGIQALIVLISATLAVSWIYSWLYQTKTADNTHELVQKADFFVSTMVVKDNDYYAAKQASFLQKKYDTLQLFSFDPNTANDNEWLLLGLSERQIKVINNYRNKGGVFYDKSDLAKMYSMSPQQFSYIAPYINLPEQSDRTQLASSSNSTTPNTNNQPDSLFYFDPNTTTPDQWSTLGLQTRQIETIQNYLSKGGHFYDAQDFAKIYSLTAEQKDILLPYVQISEPPANNSLATPPKHTYTTEIVEINHADTALLVQLKGITSFLASRIVEYRNQLGGFVSKEQIKEVYGFKEDAYLQIESQLTVDATGIKKIRLNFANIETLKQHPYLDYHQAKAIVDYRNKNGPFSSTSQLRDLQLLTKTAFEKIEPYLVTQ